jgi:hypothetical protein
VMNRIDDIKARLAAATPGSPERCHYQNTAALDDLAYLLRIAEAARGVFAALDEHGLSRTIVPMMALRIALEHGDGIVE